MSAESPAETYAGRLTARRERLANVVRRHHALGNLRAGVVLAGLAMAWIALIRGAVSPAWLVVPLVLFVWLGYRMERHEKRRELAARAVALYEAGLARLADQWAGRGHRGGRFSTAEHLYARDLDMFGSGSVFELVCAARSGIGQRILADWLLKPAEPEVVRERQVAGRELAGRLDLREDLAVLGADVRADRAGSANLLTWASRPPETGLAEFKRPATVLATVGVSVFFGFFASLAGSMQLVALPETTIILLRSAAVAVGVIHALLTWRFRQRTDRVLHEAGGAAYELRLLSALLERIERESFESSRLRELRTQLDTGGDPPSVHLHRLAGLIDLVNARHGTIVRFLGLFVLWDIHLAIALERWRERSRDTIGAWLASVGELEALCSLARLRFERPDYVDPTFAATPCFRAVGAAHPLLPAADAIPNDIALGPAPRVVVVSGSNMSGKSTLLRTIGVNCVLAQAGAPVCAEQLELSSLAIGASIRIQDSLQAGTSRFYAEILRLRAIVEATASPQPVLFLIDEMLHGTNSHDRATGAEGIVCGLLDRGAIGLLSTHDLALTEIAVAMGDAGANAHFADELVDGKMHFDYRMRPGVVNKSNAIALMRSIGLDV